MYAPIVISVDPLTLTERELQDLGGIRITITNDPDIEKNKDGFVSRAKGLQYVVDTTSYPPHTVTHTQIADNISSGYVLWDNDSNISFQFRSLSYPVPELLKMAETALEQN